MLEAGVMDEQRNRIDRKDWRSELEGIEKRFGVSSLPGNFSHR
jgi:hypothetical protein